MQRSFTIGLFLLGLLISIQAIHAQNKLEHKWVPTKDFTYPSDLEVTIWAKSPLFYNPTNMDVDEKGRIWVAEGVRYRRHKSRSKGDRIVILEDTNMDGTADKTSVFVQDEQLVAPLGVSVFDNKVVVAQPPDMLVYTDVNRNGVFEKGIDTKEVLLTGFNGGNHDHSLHAVVSGPDGKWYFNQGNCGAKFKDNDGKQFYAGGSYYKSGGGDWFFDSTEIAGMRSDDGNVWTPGFAARMNPDGTQVQIIGHGFRNSYEHCVSSLGDVFQNDNDDPPACRTSWLMEGGFLGYFSRDGKRSWRADIRPGQSIPVAHWRQDDPGSMPAGDVYGRGAPTGICFYENGALPAKYAGMVLTAEAREKVIFGYHPKTNGAGIHMGKRSHFFEAATNNMFRPSDVMVGADGAIYVADWFDPGVGGHRDADKTLSGAIYRIAPKGFKPAIAQLTGNKIKDAIIRMKSPATNVRYTGFVTLRDEGKHNPSIVLNAIKQLMNDKDPYIAARGAWLLPFLGTEGKKLVHKMLLSEKPDQRLLAFRILRNSGKDVIDLAGKLVNDKDSAVRREVAVALKDANAARKLPLVVELFKQFEGKIGDYDRFYIEAVGLAAEDIEDKVWEALHQAQKEKAPAKWSESFAIISWRLMTRHAVAGHVTRVKDSSLSAEARKLSLDAIAFVNDKAALDAMADLTNYKEDPALNRMANWWLFNRGLGPWADFGTMALLKDRGIYDPENVQVTPMKSPPPATKSDLNIKRILKLKGDAKKGKQIAARCYTCHQFDGGGVDYGPNLNGWAKSQGKQAFLNAVIYPSQGIAHGYTGKSLILNKKERIDGLVIYEPTKQQSGKVPFIIKSMGGITQFVPKSKVSKVARRKPSLMLSADQLGLKEQDLADLMAYMMGVN